MFVLWFLNKSELAFIKFATAKYKNNDCSSILNEANKNAIPIKCHTWTEAGCMVKRVLVGGVSAKLTQFSWGGGGECPDHIASPAAEPTSRMGKHVDSLLKNIKLPGFLL